jgi:hypothetical protein
MHTVVLHFLVDSGLMDNTNLKVRTMYIPDIWIEAGTQKEQYDIAGDGNDDDSDDDDDNSDDDDCDDDSDNDDNDDDDCDDDDGDDMMIIITIIIQNLLCKITMLTTIIIILIFVIINFLLFVTLGLNEKDIIDKVSSVVQSIRDYK